MAYSINTFDHTCQLACGDFIVSHTGTVLLLKWSKTIQHRKTMHTIPLPMLGSAPLCPIAALTSMTQKSVVGPNDPLFVLPKPSKWLPLTDSVARKHLKNISIALNIPPLTFHAFSWTGASLEHIMKHGTWRSDAIWSYLSPLLPPPLSLLLFLMHFRLPYVLDPTWGLDPTYSSKSTKITLYF